MLDREMYVEFAEPAFLDKHADYFSARYCAYAAQTLVLTVVGLIDDFEAF